MISDTSNGLIALIVQIVCYAAVLYVAPIIVEKTFLRGFIDKRALSIVMGALYVLALASLARSITNLIYVAIV